MMKKLLLVAVVALMGTSVFAQADYNKWSIEGGVGFNKPYRNMTPGYFTNDLNFLTGDLGLRWMWSEYFGMKLDYGYNSFVNNDRSAKFESTYSRADLQFVANAGKVLNFQEWTKTIGLLVHGGGGLGFAGSEFYDGTDKNVNLMSGATLQFRLGKRAALNFDASMILPVGKVDKTYDGASTEMKRGFIANGTVGLSIYLGKHNTHADWYQKDAQDLSELMAKYDDLASKVDAYRNEAAKSADVDAVQKSVNKVASDVEDLKKVKAPAGNYDEFVKALTDQGFVSAFFNVNSARVSANSINNINFLKTYLESNPSATVEVRGYADETGAADYNQKLSERRAQAAAKLLVEAGIDESRISTVGMGVDSTVDKASANGRQMARRASFSIK